MVGSKLKLIGDHCSWVHVRTEAVLTSTYNLFWIKNKKNRYTPAYPSFTV